MMKLTIKQRVVVGFAVLVILSVIMAIISYITIINMNNLSKIVKENLEKKIFMVQRERDHLDWVQGLTLYILSKNQFTGQLDYTKCGLGQWLYSEAMQNISDPELKKILKEIEKPHLELHNSAKRIISAKESSDENEARRIFLESTMPSLISTREKLKQIVDRFDKITVEVAGKAVEDMDGQANSSRTSVMIMSIVLIMFGVIFAIYLSKQIISTLGKVIKDLKESSQSFISASIQLTASSQQLAEGSTEQASSIEETSSTLEESASMIQQTTENTKHATLLSKQVKDLSDQGVSEMQELTGFMDELKKSSTQIGKIIKVIDEIAFQTNILALNAAIEAARAGEAGMGFAVVAEEVRNLAQRSAQAAKDTTIIIEGNIGLSEKGMLVTETVNNSLVDITLQAKKVSELMEEITAASQEQYQGIDQVNKAIAQMEVIVQQNSSSAEENAAAAEELNSQSQNIIATVQALSALITGRTLKEDE